MTIQFDADFVWGAATSGPQAEGTFHKKHENIFDYHYHTRPQDFYHNVGPDVASNFYNDYENDLALLKQAGVQALRISIQWTRLIDDLEAGTVDPVGADYYRRVFKTMHQLGITPYVNLHHFDLPVTLQHQYDGWQSKHVVDLYVKFATRCFELYSDQVTHWFTFNEPKVIVDGQYLYQFHYPNIVDGRLAVQAAYNLNLASAKAVAAFRQINRQSQGTIGTIVNLTPVYPASQAPEDLAAARFAEQWANDLYLEPAIHGRFPEELVARLKRDGVLWEATSDELAVIAANRIDVLGVNYYHPFRVQAPAVSPDSLQAWLPDIYFDNYDMPGRKMNLDKGWEIYPDALYDIAMTIKRRYDNLPWFVAENGIGVANEERFLKDGMVQDDYRIQFMTDHLRFLSQAITEGANCHGYFVWTGIDCWSWLNAYKNRYGLIRNDLRNQTKSLKKSGHWFSQVAATGLVAPTLRPFESEEKDHG